MDLFTIIFVFQTRQRQQQHVWFSRKAVIRVFNPVDDLFISDIDMCVSVHFLSPSSMNSIYSLAFPLQNVCNFFLLW